ncbi:hypothetical protein HQ545_03280 [Candidatus Woesearchaeota archaeon]|nr:hypothetical protein [Candidatus Woesearchaeota archaeon]
MERGNERVYSAAVGRFVKVKDGARESYKSLFGKDSDNSPNKSQAIIDYVVGSIDERVIDIFCQRGELFEGDWESIRVQVEHDLLSRYDCATADQAMNFLYGRLEHVQALLTVLPYSEIAQKEMREKRRIPYDILG